MVDSPWSIADSSFFLFLASFFLFSCYFKKRFTQRTQRRRSGRGDASRFPQQSEISGILAASAKISVICGRHFLSVFNFVSSSLASWLLSYWLLSYLSITDNPWTIAASTRKIHQHNFEDLILDS